MESAGKRLRTRTDIGKDIERCLDDLKITHAELAEMLNVSDKTVDRMIGGKGPTTKYASALAKVTGIHMRFRPAHMAVIVYVRCTIPNF